MALVKNIRLSGIRYLLPVALLVVGAGLFTSNLEKAAGAGSNGITVLTARTPREGATTNVQGMAQEVADKPIIELFVNSPIHNAPAGTYDKNAVPFSYRVEFAVCHNSFNYARVITRFDQMGGHHSNYEGTAESNWQVLQDDEHFERFCTNGKKWCTTSRTGSGTLNLSSLKAGATKATIQAVAKWNSSASGDGNTPPSANLDRNDSSDRAFRMGRATAVNVWLNFAEPTTTPTPTPTPTPDKPAIDVSKTDNRETIRPGQSLTYDIVVKNTGNVDLTDVKVVDQVPSHLEITSVSDGGDISGQTVTWDNISLDVNESKTLHVTAKVKDDTNDGTVLHNTVDACSDEKDVCDDDDDRTRVEKPGDADIEVTKTDNRDITRPGHTLTYEIEVKNTGTVDLTDVEVKDVVPSHLTITSASNGGDISGQTVTWNGIDLDVNESNTFYINVKVKNGVSHGTTLVNKVDACSDDQDVCDEAEDKTVVEVPKVAGVKTPPTIIIKEVPVTAKTGGAGALALTSLVSGAGGLVFLKRRFF